MLPILVGLKLLGLFVCGKCHKTFYGNGIKAFYRRERQYLCLKCLVRK